MNQCLEATGLDGKVPWELEGDPLGHRALTRLIDRWTGPILGGFSYGKDGTYLHKGQIAVRGLALSNQQQSALLHIN